MSVCLALIHLEKNNVANKGIKCELGQFLSLIFKTKKCIVEVNKNYKLSWWAKKIAEMVKLFNKNNFEM